MKYKFLFSFTIAILMGYFAQSQVTYYHIHSNQYYLVSASGGIEYTYDGEIILTGTISEELTMDPIGDNDPEKQPPNCAIEKAKQGQSVVCGPYTTRSGGFGQVIEGCGNTNLFACKITITNPNGSQVIFTYTES